MPAANASALASANPFSATNDLTIAHVMGGYDAAAGFVVMKFVAMKKISDKNNAFFMREALSLHATMTGGISNRDGKWDNCPAHHVQRGCPIFYSG